MGRVFPVIYDHTVLAGLWQAGTLVKACPGERNRSAIVSFTHFTAFCRHSSPWCLEHQFIMHSWCGDVQNAVVAWEQLSEFNSEECPLGGALLESHFVRLVGLTVSEGENLWCCRNWVTGCANSHQPLWHVLYTEYHKILHVILGIVLDFGTSTQNCFLYYIY